MAKSFVQMAEQAMAEVDGISAEQAQQRLKENSKALLIDVRDAADIASTGVPAGGINISLGMLAIRADRRAQAEEQQGAGSLLSLRAPTGVDP